MTSFVRTVAGAAAFRTVCDANYIASTACFYRAKLILIFNINNLILKNVRPRPRHFHLRFRLILEDYVIL